MTGHGALLSIDLWHTHLAAVVRGPDGRVAPVVLDGAVVTPVGVAVTSDGTLHLGRGGAQIGQQQPQSYVRLPGQRLLDDDLTVGGVQVDPVDVMAAVLAMVVREVVQAYGTLPGDVVISTPARWTSRQRQGLRAAATKAGLAQPRLVTGAESIVREELARGRHLPTGKVAVVCRLADTVGELVVLQHEPAGFDVLAAFDIGELGETPGASLIDQAAAALGEAGRAAAFDDGQVVAVFCDAPAPTMTALASALTPAAGAAAPPGHVGELAAAFGGARTVAPPPTSKAMRPGREVAVAAGTAAVAWAVAAALVVQVLNSGQVVDASFYNPRFLITTWYAWGLAPVFGVLGAVSLAIVAAERRAAGRGRDGGGESVGRDPLLGSALLLTAGLGVGAAVVFAVQGAATFEVSPAPMLRWTLASTVPLAAILAVLGILVAVRRPPAAWSGIVPWRRRLRPPLSAVLVGGLAAVLLVTTQLGIPRVDSDLWWRMEHVAGYGLGLAIGLHLVSDPWRRAMVGFLLSAIATYAINQTTDNTIVGCLIAAITLWWLTRLLSAAGVTLPFAHRVAAEES